MNTSSEKHVNKGHLDLKPRAWTAPPVGVSKEEYLKIYSTGGFLDLRLRFPDEATAAARMHGFWTKEDGWLVSSHYYALDPVGPLPTGWRNAEPSELPGTDTLPSGTFAMRVGPGDGASQFATIWDESFHINFRVVDKERVGDLAPLNAFLVWPRTPQRGWAGDRDFWDMVPTAEKRSQGG